MSDSEHDPLSQPVQQPLPLAFVNGQAVIEKPEDLYIPPDALEVILETFEGPLDLLLYLIRKQKFDIVNMPVLQVTKQYLEYVDMMQDLKLELAAEYLLMAAILAEIKSRMLLPKHTEDDEDEGDPRAELIRRLREYEVVKQAAEELDQLPRAERDVFNAKAIAADDVTPIKIIPQTTLRELVLAMHSAMQRAKAFEHHQIAREVLSTRERMAKILSVLKHQEYTPMQQLFTPQEGRSGAVVTFLAILELVKEGLIDCIQAQPFSNVHVRLSNDE
ncbi:segregation and condensation protein A [Alteromonas flava]|uniref:segregation and condensation protein A n=1 Tax=Alteromonas flava TaxID=2048003 RepID=UPI000C28DE38|nr:ScpA family protein [Alteromonas flava]